MSTEMTTPTEGARGEVVTMAVSAPPMFYNTSPATVEGKGGNIFCRNCGVVGPVKSPRCFPDDPKNTVVHRFREPGEVDDATTEEKPKKIRLIWKIVLALILLACYGVSIAYVVIPVQKFLNQDPVTAVNVLTASVAKPIPFPGIQICNFNYLANIESFEAYYISNNATYPVEFNFSVSPIDMGDYGYDAFDCYELNNLDKGLSIFSKRQKIVVVVKVPVPEGNPANNSDCWPDLCNPDLDEDAPIRDIDPVNDALGVSIAAFRPTGKKKTLVEDDVIFLPSGSFTQVSLTYMKTYRFGNEVPEESYQMRTSSVKYGPNTYAINYTEDGDSFQMEEVVFAEISFGELSYTEVNETKPYEAFNAFGDATAIAGFFTGFGFFGGPTFLPLIMENAHRPFWKSIFYAD